MGSTLKVSNWAGKLFDFIAKRKRTPFEWGENDCALFVGDAVFVTTDVDFADVFRGRYTTAIGSVRALKAEGVETASEFVTKVLGEPVVPSLVRRGDVVEYEAEEGIALGICIGGMITSPGKDGLVFLPMKSVTQGWRI